MKLPALLLFLLLAACSTVPGTGRSRLTPMMSLDEQMNLGKQAYKETLSKAKIIKTGPEADMVRRIGERIAQSPLLAKLFPEAAKEFKWQFTLIDDPKTINAWALPGGKTAVYSGLLKVTQDEDSLAMVMGHEITHAVAEHGAERMAQQVGFTGLLGLADLALGSSKNIDPKSKELIMTGLGVGGQVAVLLPFSRTHESEADELGLYFAADAGYDPHASIGLWQRMSQLGGDKPPEFLSTHPSDGHRIERLQKEMKQAEKYYRRAQRRLSQGLN